VRITFEPVAEAVSTLAAKLWNRDWRSWRELIRRCAHHPRRNAAAYESRRRAACASNSS